MKLASKTLSVLGASLATLTFATAAQADSPPWAYVESIAYAGTGCPAGSVAENLSDDLKAFTLLFDEYFAEAGPGVPFREKRKNCTVNIDLKFPQGWSFTVIDVDYRGYASLDRRVNGVQKSTYYFQGSRRSLPLQSTFRGPLDEDYHIRDTLGLSAWIWSPCGANRSLNINTQVRVDNRRNRNGSGLMTLDSIDGQLKHIYGIRWRRCH